MKKEKLHFYLLRLRNSSLPEIICRVKQYYFIKRLKRQISEKKNPVNVPKISYNDIKYLQLPNFHGQIRKNLVQKILDGELFSHDTEIESIRKFEKGYLKVFFSDLKFENRQPDIRTVWEPARLQHLVILLKYFSQTKESSDKKYAEQFVRDSAITWIQENPFLFGPHYTSAMECGLRIPVFFYCLKSLENLNASEYQLILDTIYHHGWWISKRLSLFSSLGNHTIAECVGLIFAGAIFRNSSKGQRWLKTGRELLKNELDHQILDDGGPAEQSLNYHRFVLDLYWLAIDFIERNDLQNFSDLKRRLIRAEGFITAFENVDGTLPSIGDSDDGYAIAPRLHPRRISLDKTKRKIQTFSSSGYTIINDKNVALIFDHGPLGMTPLYNHGHADALSITLTVEGKEMLIDPGTYKYNGEPEFRKYFKGTRSHNTVTIDGLDQAVQETGFIWSRPYKARLMKSIETDDWLYLLASHDGYDRIKKPVRHLRSIINFDKTDFIIKDTFSGKGIHTFELNYHVHPDSKISFEDNGWWKIDHHGTVIYIRLLHGVNFNIVKGQRTPLFGWYSPAYGIKRETGVLNCNVKGTPKEVSFTTVICANSPQESATLYQGPTKFEKKIENS